GRPWVSGGGCATSRPKAGTKGRREPARPDPGSPDPCTPRDATRNALDGPDRQGRRIEPSQDARPAARLGASRRGPAARQALVDGAAFHRGGGGDGPAGGPDEQRPDRQGSPRAGLAPSDAVNRPLAVRGTLGG